MNKKNLRVHFSIAYLLFADDSSLPSGFSFLFLGCGLCTNVQSWVWNWHNTQLVCPSLITHLLFLRRHASHGLSLRLRIFVPDPSDVVLLMLAERCCVRPLKGLGEGSMDGSRRGPREAIAMGAVRAIVLGATMVEVCGSIGRWV